MASTLSAEDLLRSATQGFDHLFANDIDAAQKVFESEEAPFHLLGLGVVAFLQAALGMETGLMDEATRCLTASEAGAKKQARAAKSLPSIHRFDAGMEWEVMHADAVVLLGLTHALSESYRGYLQCVYELNRRNSAHSKFNKLFKTVYPNGLQSYATPATTPLPSRRGSDRSLRSSAIQSKPTTASKSGFFSRWFTPPASVAAPGTITNPPSGPVEELVLSGTAFGYGLFNLVLSLLPAKIRNVVGFFGFNHDRMLALQALAVSAARNDIHSVFAGLVLMTYHGVVLLLSGYQADEAHIIKQYKAIVSRVDGRYPDGSLWILNKAKIQRMTYDTEGAIETLRDGLKPERKKSFSQADTLLTFELAWTLLSHRRYEETAKQFLDITKLNSWSHATYYFIAAGCYFSLKDYNRAQKLLDKIPDQLDKRKLSGRDMPTETFIKKKLAFYKRKQARLGGDENRFVEAIRISPAEEIAIFWNTHARIESSIAIAHIQEWSSLTPAITDIESKYLATSVAKTENDDLDTVDELAIRSLLLGIVHRTLAEYTAARAFLLDALKRAPGVEISSWVGGVSAFELAVVDLKEAEVKGTNMEPEEAMTMWEGVLAGASKKLDEAYAMSTKQTDLSSRLDSRIVMLRDEIFDKRGLLGLPA
ncbi:outer membrane protein Iml2/Tetratricopeptide repeat protein 39 [Suillus fuscotomentosus]|uniref:Outer membrane protein Iml2/Tetratricopeptide repeat protein 39 n=1 Tax=Suillus fuscotomentosus TaxID=1912939 RepID=A0AAD4EIQ0_9AGAM|nr:outer membrane protein Iml2/Tetratricopeptide repeat protein 39 [Suillus fuscotomentosus]KAG1905718.1 outer membrane protein Iml2/Tetratricopeptide repeat protein 39 [Suillus fuscotomentosus]